MQIESRLKGISPEQRLSIYHNRTTAAVWLMALVGVFTIVEPFILYGAKIIFIPGLITPEVIVTLLNSFQGSPLHVVLALILGLWLIITGVMGMTGKMVAFKTGAALLGADLLFLMAGVILSKPDSEEIFMIVITLAVRLCFLRIIIRGISAVGFKKQLLEIMDAADRKYEEEKRQGIHHALDDDKFDDFESTEYEKGVASVGRNKKKSMVKSSTEVSKSQIFRYCSSCSAPLIEGNRFCEQCGHEVEV